VFNVGVNGRIILEWILGKECEMWTGFIWVRIGTSGGPCEHGNEPSSFTTGREFIGFSLKTLLHVVSWLVREISWGGGVGESRKQMLNVVPRSI
jgi:hypothetical protein